MLSVNYRIATMYAESCASKKVDGPFHHKNVLLIIFLTILTKSNAYLDNINMPCKSLDSLNITNGVKNADSNTIEFEGIFYPKKLYATYDYEFTNASFRQPVAKHIRGCTCSLGKPCVRLCCPRGQHLNRRDCIPNDAPFNLSVNVFDGDNSIKVDLFEHFNYVVGLPCFKFIRLDPIMVQEVDSWALQKVMILACSQCVYVTVSVRRVYLKFNIFLF